MPWSQAVVWHAVPTLFMTGLIWFVQVVHYPLLAAVGAAEFVAYERAHCRRTSFVVMPAMLMELGLAVWLWWQAPAGQVVTTTLGLGLLGLVWASTFALQVPCHQRLEQSCDAATVRRLVRTNWLRTAGWSARSGLAVWWLL
ncbi:MAG: hypothetical protein JNK49_18790 [Planctomycetes bacterium]|nr:hypothetical protein [Planctomycetota bacterium]